MKKRVWIISAVLFILIGLGFYFYHSPQKNFSTDTLFVKLSIVHGEDAEGTIGVLNHDFNPINLKIRSEGLSAQYNSEIMLQPGEEKHLPFIFQTHSLSKGIHVGQIIIDGKTTISIPVIIEIQSADVIFDSTLQFFPDKYGFKPGDILSPEIKIFDLGNAGRETVELETAMRNFNGDLVFEDSEFVVVNGSLDYSRSFNLPENLKEGSYVFSVSLKNGDSFGTSSALFSVKKKPLFAISDKIILVFVIFMSFIFFGFLLFFIYSLFHKDVLVEELKKEYTKELNMHIKSLEAQERKECQKLSPQEKHTYTQAFAAIKEKRTARFEKMFQQRLHHYYQMKKTHSREDLKKQVALWKRQGYDTSILNSYSLPIAEHFKNKIREWKRQGYDTELLEKRRKKDKK